MSELKSLAKQTAIFGISTILVRMLNWLLTPYYTLKLSSPMAMGILTDLYATVAFINVVLMFGMETSYFRFSKDHSRTLTYYAAQNLVFLISIVIGSFIIALSANIASYMGYPGKGAVVAMLGVILILDNVSNIPFAVLRQDGLAMKFMSYKLLNILINISLNLLAFQYLIPQGIVPQKFEIECIMAANLIASLVTALLVARPIIRGIGLPNREMLSKMLPYSYPLVLIGLAGMVNETLDRKLLKYWLPYDFDTNLYQIGVYSACYKLSIIMTLTIQGFRMGLEPYFFRQKSTEGGNRNYAIIMDFFNIVCGTIMVLTMLYLDMLRVIIDPRYHQGLSVVPILLLANWMLGIYYNTTVWYKLTDQTLKGGYISLIGALVTLIANYCLIPRIGYVGAALATLLCYTSMTIVSYVWGQRHFYVPYSQAFMILWIVGCIAVSYAIYYSMPHSFQYATAGAVLTVIVAAVVGKYRMKHWGR